MPQRKGLILKITLDDIQPPIWRRVEIPGNFTLADLHLIIQGAMGWCDSHLHSFDANGREFAPIDGEDDFESDAEDESKVKILGLLKRKGAEMKYTYDFGDNWVHIIVYEADAPGPVSVPRVLAGARACPPEDIGGPYSFAHIMDVVSGKIPAEEGTIERIEWLNGFDPEEFDVDEPNKRIDMLLLED